MIRLSKVLEEFIGECQHVFVASRQIQDAILVVNETVDDLVMNSKDGLICKVYMEKAYDHVCWNFVDYLLSRMSFRDQWRDWMKTCMRTTSFVVLINSGPSRFFTGSRELRQGDPLSPLLFIIVMEMLNDMIEREK